MRCFRIRVRGRVQSSFVNEYSSESDSLFSVDQDSWQHFLSTSGKDLIHSAELKCGVCGSFTIPALVFLKAIESFEDDEDAFDPDYELYRLLVEPKFDDEDEFLKYWREGGPDLNLLHGPDGDWVYDEFTSYPLGLKYEDVAILLSPQPCHCCEKLFDS